jgi:hypothetical protein
MSDQARNDNHPPHADESKWEGAEGRPSSQVQSPADAASSPAAPPRQTGSLERRSRQELYDRARELGVRGRGRMTKGDLIAAIREHARNPSPRPADETPATSYISMRDP